MILSKLLPRSATVQMMEVVHHGAAKVSENKPENRPQYILHPWTHATIMP